MVLSANAGDAGVRRALFGDLSGDKYYVRIERKTSDLQTGFQETRT
jgi:hypothetical protein